MQNAPTLNIGLELYFIAFFDLDSARINAMELGQISWVAVKEYCEALGLDEDTTEAMHHHVAAMDETYREFVRKKSGNK